MQCPDKKMELEAFYSVFSEKTSICVSAKV